MYTTARKRRDHIYRSIAEILILGILYYLLHICTGFSIPCVFRLLTGHLCPGCGITHLFICLSHLDFAGAYHANPLVMVLLGPAGIYALYRAERYIHSGRTDFTVIEIIMLCIVLITAILFAVYRNL